MIDVEQALTDALHAYASSVTPSAPPAGVADDVADDVVNSFVSTVSADRVRAYRRNRVVLTAAVLLMAACSIAIWSVRGDRATTVISPVTTARRPLNVGSWKTISTGPLSPRKFPSVLWTGRDFIVWGGQQDNVGLVDGAAYNPSTATWRMIRANPRVQAGANAVWTGTHMVVLAGSGGESYDPATDVWASLPSIDPSTSGGVGLTNAVWTGSQLLGLGVEEVKDPGNTLVLRVWTLVQNDSVWSPPSAVSVTTGEPKTRGFAYYPNQFTVWDALATTDGLVVWDGASDGWRYTIAGGWTKLPTLVLQSGISTGSTVSWQSGHLLAVVNVIGNGDRIEIATLDPSGWSPMRQVHDSYVGLAYPIAVGEQLVLLGVNGAGTRSPLLVDPATERAASMTGYPIDTTIDQGAAWSGTQLFVWGGQTPIHSGAGTSTASANSQQPNSGTSPISNQGAIWQP